MLARKASRKAINYAFEKVDFNVFINEYYFKKNYPLADDEIGIITYFGIGDTIMVSGLVHLIKKQTNAKIVLLIKPGHEFLTTLFPSVDKVNVVSKPLSVLNGSYNQVSLSSSDLKPGEYFYAHFFNLELARVIGFNKVTLFDCYKALFKLDFKSSLEAVTLNVLEDLSVAKALFTKHNLVPGKTVVLATGANSTPLIEQSFWKSLCETLTSRGYKVLLSSKADEYLINEHIIFEELTLEDLVKTSTLAGNVISFRSGICELISLFPQINLTVIFPKMSWFGGSLIEGTSLRTMWNARVSEFELELSGNLNLSNLTNAYSKTIRTISETIGTKLI